MMLTTQIEIPEYGTMKKPSPNNASSLTPISQNKKLPPTRKSLSDKALATPPLLPKKSILDQADLPRCRNAKRLALTRNFLRANSLHQPKSNPYDLATSLQPIVRPSLLRNRPQKVLQVRSGLNPVQLPLLPLCDAAHPGIRLIRRVKSTAADPEVFLEPARLGQPHQHDC